MSSNLVRRLFLSPVNSARVLRALVLIISLAALLAGSDEASARGRFRRGSANYCYSGEPRPQDELWILSTRCLPTLGCGREAGSLELRVRHYDHQQGWQLATLEEFLQSNPMPTWVFVHGNRIEPCEVVGRSRMVYQALIEQDPDQPPVRFVGWSWPTDRVRGVLKDARSKAWRTETEAYYLASLLSQLDSGGPVSLIGFSFGARVITGSLELLAGGEISSRHLPAGSSVDPDRIRVVLLSAALHNHWLLDGHYHGQALEQAQHTLSLYTCCDDALRHYRRLEKCSCPQALGYTGLARRRDWQPPAGRYEEENVAGYVGCEHSLPNYLYCPYTIARIYEAMTGQEPQESIPGELAAAAGP